MQADEERDLIEKAQKEDLKEILELQYLAYQSEAKLFGDMDIPPLRQTIEEVGEEFAKEGNRYATFIGNRE